VTRCPRHGATASPRDGGFVAGGEMIVIGLVAMMAGILLMVELWAVLDTRIAVDDAAREAARAYVEAPDHAHALTAARAAAQSVLNDRGRIAVVTGRLVDQPWSRCARVEVEVQAVVARIVMPGGGVGSTTVTGRHSELVDPYRSAEGLDGVADCVD
jgi:Flp pilus assembly protein TadG